MGGYHDAIRDGQLGKPHRGRSARRAEKRIGGHVVDALAYGTACRLSGPMDGTTITAGAVLPNPGSDWHLF